MIIAILFAIILLAVLLVSAIRGRDYIKAYKQFLKKDEAAQRRDAEYAEKRLGFMHRIDFDLGFLSFFIALAMFFIVLDLPVTACLCIYAASDAGSEVIRKLFTARIANHFKKMEADSGVYAC